jgi:pimeloyl-ACP methyl ester carboxylesterase
VTTLLISFLVVTAFAQTPTQPAPIAGPWTGAIAVQGLTIKMTVTFGGAADALTGTVDIPQQGAKGIALRGVTRTGAQVRFELPAAVVAVFDGRLDGDRIEGTFTQGPATGTFTLTRGSQAVEPPTPPTPRPPYRIGALTVTNGDVSLAGTLTMPEGPGPHPAVVLVTGSGAQNRDEEIFGFKVFAVLADHLTRQGIAVFRYDDRGVGESTGNIATSTSADFATDALAAVAQLKAMPMVDAAKVGVLGHSEGAAVAAIAAAQSSDVAFIVMLAGPGLPGDVVTRGQAADGARTLGATDAQVEAVVAAHRAAMEAAKSGAGEAEVRERVKGLIAAQLDTQPPAALAALGDRAVFIEQRSAQATRNLMTPWMRFFLAFDPAETLRKVTVPVYAAFGALDTQVPPATNEAPVRSALAGNSRATVKVYPEANHLFQKANTGQVTEYALLDKAFVAPLLEDLSAWILLVAGGR